MSINLPTFPLNGNAAIPAVGFGTYLITPETTAAAVKAAIEAGYRHVDTAQVYGNEAGVGEALRQSIVEGVVNRDDMFITTKLWPGFAQWGEQPKNKTETIDAFNASLALLGMDYIDCT